MKYQVVRTAHFNKELKRAEKRGLKLKDFQDVVNKLRKGELLEPKYKDHPLRGEYKGYRECHINPDWLLIYRKYEDNLILLLARTGTHSDLF